MSTHGRTLGTLLRHVIDLLDTAVEDSYVASGLEYRPRYTPIVRALLADGPSSILSLATRAGVTHSAASQTVSQMARRGLVTLARGGDGRERIVALSAKARAIVPALERQWARTNAASDALDRELSAPLSTVLEETIAALERRPMGARIAAIADTTAPRATTPPAPRKRASEKPSAASARRPRPHPKKELKRK